MHDLLHSALQTVQEHSGNIYFDSKRALAQRQGLLYLIKLSPPLGKLCGFDLESVVDHYFMGQSHVGDSLSCLHQLLHRDKSGRAGCEGEIQLND